MQIKYVIVGSIISIVGFTGYFVTYFVPPQSALGTVFNSYFPVWINIGIVGLPIIVSGFVKRFHIVFAVISSVALVLIWFSTVRWN